MQKQTKNSTNQQQINSQQVNLVDGPARHKQSSVSDSSGHIQHIQEYCQYLKQFRHQAKPPISNPETKQRICRQFDQVIMKRTLKQVTNYIKMKKQRKISEKPEHTSQYHQENQCTFRKRTQTEHQQQKFHENTKKQNKTRQNVLLTTIDKIILYTWQLCNARVIIASSSSIQSSLYTMPQIIIHDIHRLCISTSRIYISKWGIRHVTMQAMQITYFNLLKNKIIDVAPDQNGSLCCLIQAILADTEGEAYQKIIKESQKKNENKIIEKTQLSESKDKNIKEEQFKKQDSNQQSQSHKNSSSSSPQSEQKYQNQTKLLHHTSQTSKHLSHSPTQNLTKATSQKCQHQTNHKHIHSSLPINTPQLHKKHSIQLQLQWFIYIIEYCIYNCDDFIKSTFIQLSNGTFHHITNSAVTFLHFISLLMNKIVNDRITTQIVRGYPCNIDDIKRMYNRKGKSQNQSSNILAIEMKISWNDYQWIISPLFKQSFRHYKNQISKQLRYLCSQNNNLNTSTKPPIYDKVYIQCIMNIIGVINCCNFLGGYNGILQKKTTKLVMEFGLEFLEISYLIYELCYAKKRNIQVKMDENNFKNVKKEYIKNLFKVLNSDRCEESNKLSQDQKQQKSDQKQEEQVKEEQEEQLYQIQPEILLKFLPLQQGQIVAVVRMLSNLVHINEQAQKYFQDNLKYFRIIMSLTHQVQGQLTMKNWAIVFLRNVSQRSSIMRTQLQKLKIDVKIDPGEMPNFI